jgi:hypothetical protein
MERRIGRAEGASREYVARVAQNTSTEIELTSNVATEASLRAIAPRRSSSRSNAAALEAKHWGNACSGADD